MSMGASAVAAEAGTELSPLFLGDMGWISQLDSGIGLGVNGWRLAA